MKMLVFGAAATVGVAVGTTWYITQPPPARAEAVVDSVVVGAPGVTPARPVVAAPPSGSTGTKLTVNDVVPTSTATQAFAWQPRPLTRFDLARRTRVAKQTEREALDAFYRQADVPGLQEKWPDISAYFEVHPQAMKTAYTELHERTMPANAIVPFYIALGKARVSEARELLLSIVRDSSDTPMDRTRAIFALVDREDTGEALAQELAVMARAQAVTHNQQFLKGEAMLGLSMMAGLKRRNADIVKTSTNTVHALLQTRDADNMRLAMKAVGNMANSALLSVAEPVMKESDPYVRMDAAYAFRRMNPRESEALVLNWLAQEQHPLVKAKIYQIVQMQHFDMHTGASEHLTRQAVKDMPSFSSGVDRRTVIRLLGQSQVKSEPWVRESLVAQARYEHSHNTGYLDEFAEILTPAEMWAVLQ